MLIWVIVITHFNVNYSEPDVKNAQEKRRHDIVPGRSGETFKEEIVRKLSVDQKVCVVGNGFNDVQMFDLAELAIAVLDTEGMYAGLLSHADVLVRAAPDALDLLLKPNRLRATLRN